ncbi:MAG TPA: hypothetical protein VLG40_03940 [Candidatus Saccharimonas sp.]|nr:hypothetical protein [Candidatus Saccharimonas sp.]
MDRVVDRRVAPTDLSRALATVVFVYSIPRWCVRYTDGILTLPGQNEVERVAAAVRAYNGNIGKYLLVAGSYPEEETWEALPIERLQQPPYNLTRTANVLIQPQAQNTKVQMEWAVEMVREHGIRSLSLYVTNYHTLRAYFTLLRALQRAGLRIPVIPVPLEGSPDQISPEEMLSYLEMFDAESARIDKYRGEDFGDVLMPDEVFEYLNWLYDSFITPLRRP